VLEKMCQLPTPPLKSIIIIIIIIINIINHLGHSTESKHSSLLALRLHIMFTNRDPQGCRNSRKGNLTSQQRKRPFGAQKRRGKMDIGSFLKFPKSFVE